MKNIYLVLAALITMPLFAVTVKECPEKISVTLTGFELTPWDKVKDDYQLGDEEQIEEAKKAHLRLQAKYARVSADLVRVSAEKAVCKYVDYDKDSKAKFFTRAGRDLLRVATPQGETHIGFYIDISEYSTKGLKTEKAAGIVYEVSADHGEFSHVVNIGKVPAAKIELE